MSVCNHIIWVLYVVANASGRVSTPFLEQSILRWYSVDVNMYTYLVKCVWQGKWCGSSIMSSAAAWGEHRPSHTRGEVLVFIAIICVEYLCAVNVIIMRGHGQRKSIVMLLEGQRDDLVIDRDCPFAATTVNSMLMKDAFIKLG